MQSLCLGLALIIPQNCFIHIYVLQNDFRFKYFALVNKVCTLFSHSILLLLLLLLLLIF